MTYRKITFIISLLPIILSLVIAFLINAMGNHYPDEPERAVKIIGLFLIILLIIPVGMYLMWRKKESNPWILSSLIIGIVSILAVSVYFYWISSLILFPADILIWSESDFINDILKFRVGYPLYTAQENNESFIYTPGTQLLTYFIACVFGKATYIPIYRIIQVIFTLMAAVVAFLCSHKLIDMSSSKQRLRSGILWLMASLPFLFLIATNSLTNLFTHNLHNDALAQFVSIFAYYVLLIYAFSRKKYLLILMVILPAIGFLVKQSLVIWAVFYFIHLAIFDRPRSFKRLLMFPFAVSVAIGAVVCICYIRWGEHFIYWITVPGHHDVSPLRAFQHMLDVWIYIVIGLIGGAILLREKNLNLLWGPWLIWFFFILIEAYTSGIAWMLNHIGPGSLIAGCWFWAGLAKVWPMASRLTNRRSLLHNWLRAGITTAMIICLFSGLGVIRIPLKSLPSDAYRYISEIEREFEDYSSENVLLDAGTWIYLKEGVVMKDRSPSIGDRGYNESGDFSGILERLAKKKYSKILVRNLHSPDFGYDYWLWRKSSGIRQALLDNYREIGQIKAVARESYQYNTFLFSEINILVPKVD